MTEPTLGGMCEAEREVYERDPQQHARISRLVEVSMDQRYTPCRDGECDEGELCGRHSRFNAARYVALVDRWRAIGTRESEK